MKTPHILLAACLALAWTLPASAADEVNMYSTRKEDLIKPLLDQFTAKSGIKVNLVTGKDDALLERLKQEGRNSPADVFLTADAGRLYRAKDAGLLQSVDSKALNTNIPSHLRDPDGQWFGLSLRARPIMYAKNRVKPESLSTYEDLADPKWKGKICVRSSDSIYNQSMLAAMIAHDGESKALEWTRGIVANFARKPAGGDRDQIKNAADGQCDIALANTYYLAGMAAGNDEAARAAADKIGVFWPNQADRGVHINVSGAGVTAASANKNNAIKLLEYLASDDAQSWYAEVNQEYPVRDGIEYSKTLQQWGQFKPDTLNLSELGRRNADAVKLMNSAGWQ
ncbi:MAG: Fe(3+) ABC transporter substrate-binding protein [Thiotrichales bacterium]